jgi:hypothetical protein
MDIPQAAIDAAMKAADCSCGPDFHEYDCLTPDQDEMRVYLEAAVPHLNGACALHGGLDQADVRELKDALKATEARGPVRVATEESAEFGVASEEPGLDTIP